ncbi:YgjV family protein [Candidatus Saccharibacteria bacterium]|nr:YgjV family protein [Candidatus Saccharibacteria bacterium]
MMDNEVLVFILGQAFGIIALICTVVSMQLKKKRPLMILQTASEAFIVAQYLVKGAITGSFMAMVSFIRDVIFTKHHKKRTPVWVLIILYVIMTVLTILSWAGPLSILPYVGSLIYAFTLWYGKVKWIKLGNAVGNTPYLFYTLLTGNYALFVMTLLEVISSAIGFIRHDYQTKKKKAKKS